MSYEFYKAVHIAGIVWLFASLGGHVLYALAGIDRDGHPARGFVMKSHGVALLLVFVAGFGMHAKLGISGMPGWFIAKLVLWLVVGGIVMLPLRKPELAKPVWFGIPLLGAIGAWLAAAKPF